MLLLAAGATGAQPPEEPLPVFRADVALVRVDAQVVGKNGQPVADLRQEDFLVEEDGQVQRIAYFGRESDPLDVLLLLDVSGSMRKSLEELAGAANAALRALQPQDRAAVMLFSRRTEVAQDFTAQTGAIEQALRAALRESRLGAGTLLNPCLMEAARFLAGQPVRGRRAMLVVTDNEGLNYQSPDEEVIAQLLAADTVLNALVVRNSKPSKPRTIVNPDFTPANVFGIAEATGGEALAARAGSAFAPLLERIRTRYLLQYPAPQGNPGAFRRIRVELSPAARQRYPGARVRARSGYTLTAVSSGQSPQSPPP